MIVQNTQKIRNAKRLHAVAEYDELGDIYGTYSRAKEKAMLYCHSLMNKYNGKDLRILSWNTFIFTVGFYGVYDGKKAFFYITPNNDYCMYL